jgi:hypothetical protein
MSKETQSTIEQIQRWIKSYIKYFYRKKSFCCCFFCLDTHTNRDPYPIVRGIKSLKA